VGDIFTRPEGLRYGAFSEQDTEDAQVKILQATGFFLLSSASSVVE